MEVDEGMFFQGLQAAAWRVPFLPTRAGLGSDVLTSNPDLRLVRSPYGEGSPFLNDPADADVELVAMPALNLDAAVVHTNRADVAGNGQILGPDVFFDPLFLGAAERRFVTTERIVDNGALADEGPLSSVVIHRMMTDGVAETPGGAHFTANPPDYGRDEAFQKEYAAAAGDPEAWATFAGQYVQVTEAEYQAHVRERSPA
jgi:glutaconate CoA-transferase subunit A